MAYLEFDKFPDLIEYYTTVRNGTLLKEGYITIKECTLLKDIEHFMYLPNCMSQTTLPTKSYNYWVHYYHGQKISTLGLVNILPYMISWPLHPKI